MNYIEQDLWSNGKGAPLVFLLPGGTGTKRPAMRGFDAMAATFWMHGFSALIFIAPGQDGYHGTFSMQKCLDTAKSCLQALINDFNPSLVILFGSCSGGTLAAHLLNYVNVPVLLILWETPLCFAPEDTTEFVKRATAQGMVLADDFYTHPLHLKDVADSIVCPVLVGYGDATLPPIFNGKEDLDEIRVQMPHAGVEGCLIHGADHNLTRGSNTSLLDKFLNIVLMFVKCVTAEKKNDI